MLYKQMRYKRAHLPLLIWLMLLLALLASGVGAQKVYAQVDAPTPTTAPAEEGRQISANDVALVAQELWCPLCSGVRLDTCELKACDQMREEIAIQLANGMSTESIKAYFLEQYGPQVLGEPPRQGFNLLAWIMPFVVLVGAGALLLFRSRRLLTRRTVVPAAAAGPDANFTIEDEGVDGTEDRVDDRQDGSRSEAQHEATNAASAKSEDPYERALNEELRQYE